MTIRVIFDDHRRLKLQRPAVASDCCRDCLGELLSVVVQHAALVGGLARMLGQLGLRRWGEPVQSLSDYLAASQGS